MPRSVDQISNGQTMALKSSNDKRRNSLCGNVAVLPLEDSKEIKRPTSVKFALNKSLSSIGYISSFKGDQTRRPGLSRLSFTARRAQAHTKKLDANQNPVRESRITPLPDEPIDFRKEQLPQSDISCCSGTPRFSCSDRGTDKLCSLSSPARFGLRGNEHETKRIIHFVRRKENHIETSEYPSCRVSLCPSAVANIKDKRLSLDIGAPYSQAVTKEVKKTSKWSEITKGQTKMWSQRRNTIDSQQELQRRQQAMLRVSSSGRISLRQKSQNHNPENRLSLFGNTAESLITLMHQPEMLHAFRTFLKSEYSEENLDFWLDCEHYRNLKPNRRKKMAAKIYATYLDVEAPREINIDAGTRARTERNLDNPKENMFDEAQKHIFDLMERDSFRRFITSDKVP